MTGAATTVEFKGDDFEWLFELLFHAVETTSREQRKPCFIINGTVYRDFMKIAMLIPDGELKPHHQHMADELFQKTQNGYRRTAINIAHRCNQIENEQRSIAARIAVQKAVAASVLSLKKK